MSERAQEGPLLAALMISTKLDGTYVCCAWGAGPPSGPVWVGMEHNITHVWMLVMWGLRPGPTVWAFVV